MPKKVANKTSSKAVEEAKKKILLRPLLQEREFPCAALCPFYDIASRTYKLHSLLRQKTDCNLQIVQEFYTQACLRNVWRFPLRGVQIDFTLENFRNYVSLPPVENCRFKYYTTNEDEIPEDKISEMLDYEGRISWQRPRGGQKYLLRTCLSVQARIWLHFGKDYFWPSSNRNRLTREQALCVYLFMTKEPIDVGHLMYTSLRDHIHDHSCGLMLPHLISDFCTTQGVESGPADVLIKPLLKFQYKSIKPRGTSDAQPSDPDEPDLDAPVEPIDHGEASSSQQQPTMQQLFDMMQNIHADVGQCLTTLHDHGARLSRIEDFIAQQAQGAGLDLGGDEGPAPPDDPPAAGAD